MIIKAMSRSACKDFFYHKEHGWNNRAMTRTKEGTFRVISIDDPGLSPEAKAAWECKHSGYQWKEEDTGFLFPENSKNVLSLMFHDMEWEQDGLVLFNENHAKKILDFFAQIEKDKDSQFPCWKLFIHCHAGVSRSGAVADFAREYFDLDYSEFRRNNLQIVPNTHIARVLRDVWQYGGKYNEVL